MREGINMNKIRILIADDHSMIRCGLKQILEKETDIEVIAEAKNGEEAILFSKEYIPDIVLMDINMPVIDGFQALEALTKEKIESKVIILTIHKDKAYLIKAVNLGAKGYILKDSELGLLVEAIRAVHKGEVYIQSELTMDLIQEFNKAKLYNEKKGELTQREIEVLELVAEGMLNKEIAAKLNISEKTVKNHVSNIFKKLDLADRTQAAVYALRNHIIRA